MLLIKINQREILIAVTPRGRKIILTLLSLRKKFNRSIDTLFRCDRPVQCTTICTISDTRRLDCNSITKKAGNLIFFYQEVAVLKEKEFLRTNLTDK